MGLKKKKEYTVPIEVMPSTIRDRYQVNGLNYKLQQLITGHSIKEKVVEEEEVISGQKVFSQNIKKTQEQVLLW